MTASYSLPAQRMLHLSKQGWKLSRLTNRLRLLAKQRLNAPEPLDHVRAKIAQKLGGVNATPVPVGSIPAGTNSREIRLWQAGKYGSKFLKKANDNPHEFDASRYLVGADLRHTPQILGVSTRALSFHIFIAWAEGKRIDQFSDTQINAIQPSAHELGSDAMAALAGKSTLPHTRSGLLERSWVRKHLALSGIDLDTLDADIAQIATLPHSANHNDLSSSNVLFNGSDFSIIDLGNMKRTPLGGNLCTSLVNAVRSPSTRQIYTLAFKDLVNWTGIDPQALHLSAHIQASGFRIRSAIVQRNPRHFAHAIDLLHARHDSPKTVPLP